MVETVALAIWRKREEGFPDRVKRCTPDNIDRATGAWQQALGEARAAIEAMREPTVEQIDAALAGDNRWSVNAIPRIAAAYRAMIDAALAEPARDPGGAS